MLSFDRRQLLQLYEAATPLCAAGKIERVARTNTFPIDFANKFPVSKRGRHCQSVVRCIRQSEWLYLQAAALFEFCTSVFLAWRPSPE